MDADGIGALRIEGAGPTLTESGRAAVDAAPAVLIADDEDAASVLAVVGLLAGMSEPAPAPEALLPTMAETGRFEPARAAFCPATAPVVAAAAGFPAPAPAPAPR